MTIKKIISGGQTGADQAGLDAAIVCGILHGGSIPKGRKTENGILDSRYKLDELESSSYGVRTEKNVTDSDGTVIFSQGPLTEGSLLTRHKAEFHNKPVLHLDFTAYQLEESVILLDRFIRENQIAILNIAGPRASKDPQIYTLTYNCLLAGLRDL